MMGGYQQYRFFCMTWMVVIYCIAHNTALIVGLAVGSSSFLLLLVVLTVLLILWRRKKRREGRSTVDSSNFDEELHSPFASSLAARRPWNDGNNFGDLEKAGIRLPWDYYVRSQLPEGEEFKIERPQVTLNYASQAQ